MTTVLHTLQSPEIPVQQSAAKGAASRCTPLQRRCKALHAAAKGAASPLQRRCKPLQRVLHQVLHTARPLKGAGQRAAQFLLCSRSRRFR